MPEDDFEDGNGDNTIVGDRLLLTTPVGTKADEAYVIVIAGPNVGEMFPIGRGGDIGRGADVEFRLVDTEISRRHAKIRVVGPEVYVEDLASTNGTFVNGEPVTAQRLRDGDKIQVGTTTILKFSYHDDLEQQFQRRMYEGALRDGLTKAFNKAYFEERLESEVAFSLRHGSDLSLLMLDLDHFKKVNDNFGHPAGDYVLSTFASGIFDTVRKEDVFARFGGEEFALVSRGLDIDAAVHFAERIRRGVASHDYRYQGKSIPVSISIGVAALPDPSITDAAGFVAAADKALYEAKGGGRNRVVVYRSAG